ncbi:DUF4097 family beta strand repeat-containing protein [Fodinibius halophilus]|uniref:DUF4097 domain-containing protein n=1 Tax=Fodinibius halophilus TaxID=1736908 RepID=A0A6M1TB15_9BACT|nr:DUF4097 family beta strand repeat-containing protein [Fodinibius halophilus]NGP88154.1 hypothetical protein [Fodinibius halophilus]
MKYFKSFFYNTLYATFALTLLTPLLSPFNSVTQNTTRTIKKSMTFADPADPGNKFKVMNIDGSVTVEAYDGDTIELTIKEQIDGTPGEVRQAREELEYKVERRGNLILTYLDAPFITFRFDGKDVHYSVDRNDDSYIFIHNLHLKVPQAILLDVSSINKGGINIDGNFKAVEASNVNGSLNLTHLTSKTRANTINGDITVSYDKVPVKDSEYHTINGTIEVNMPDDLSADIYFKSLHGDIYTDFQNVKPLTPKVKTVSNSNRSKVMYEVKKFSPLRIANGSVELRFEVLNGDVYIRKQS